MGSGVPTHRDRIVAALAARPMTKNRETFDAIADNAQALADLIYNLEYHITDRGDDLAIVAIMEMEKALRELARMLRAITLSNDQTREA